MVNHNVSAIDELCPACGLCCNGVLFGDVELQRGDNASKLTSLGVELVAKGRKKVFNQPCTSLVGGLCKIYENRPARCRSFDCRALQRVQRGELNVAAARKSISQAKRLSEEVRRLVRALGNIDESEPLNRRYAAVMMQPIDLAGDESQMELRGDLMLAVSKLVDVLERDFLV